MEKNNPLYLKMHCDLVYAPLNAEPLIFSFLWQEGMTVQALVEASDFMQNYPEIARAAVGIFARRVAWETLIKPGDRVELYRPLLIDPKEKRRRKAKQR